MADQALIHLDGVSKIFVTDEVETHALSNIAMDIHKSEYVSISGPSGCGKSTLLAILGLLDSPSQGTYVLNGNPVPTCRERGYKCRGMKFIRLLNGTKQ